MRTLTSLRTGLFAGAAAMALAGAAGAQETAEGRSISPANAAAPAVAGEADQTAPLTQADTEGPEAAIVEEEIAETAAPAPADAPHDEAVAEVLDEAQEEAIQNDVHILPTETREAEIRPWHLWAGEDEESGVAELRAFMAMDADGDLLLTREEWDAAAPGRADFGALDVNESGQAGFAEYRVWQAVRTAEAANDDGAAMGGPLEAAEPADAAGPDPARPPE